MKTSNRERSVWKSVAVGLLATIPGLCCLGCDTYIHVRARVTDGAGEPLVGALASIPEMSGSVHPQPVPTDSAGCVTLDYVTGGFGTVTLKVSMQGRKSVDAKVPMSEPAFYEIKLVPMTEATSSEVQRITEADLRCPRG